MILNNNQTFLKIIHPHRVILISFIVWLLLFSLSPLKVNIQLNPLAYLFVLCSFLAFIYGGFLCRDKKLIGVISRINVSTNIIKQRKRTFKHVLLIACIGLTLKIIDRFFVRGISLDANFETNREMMQAAGGNPIGIMASFLVPFCYFPLFYLYKYKFKVKLLTRGLVYFLFIGQVFDSILLSSRSAIFVNILLFILYLLYFKRIRISGKLVFKFTVLTLLLMSIMSYMFIERTKTFAGEDAYDLILYSSNFNFSVSANEEFLRFFYSSSDSIKSVLLSYITTVQYFVHGMFEFSYVYDQFKPSNHTFGQYTFVTYYRFLAILFGNDIDINNLLNLSPRVGVYTTLLGPLFIDFGWFNLLFMALSGYLVMKIYYKAMVGVNWAVILYFYFFIALAFWPVFNFINGSGGIFILTSIILLSFLTQIKNYKVYETKY